jgi:flagellum-specific peptidoglycan hydrolase FlgJ
MRNKLKQQLITYLMSVTVLFTLVSCSEPKNNHNADAPDKPTVKYNLNVHQADFSKLPLLQPTINNSSVQSFERYAGESPFIVQAIQKEQIKELANIELISVAKYEVTAHYLNVRENANAKSKILELVQKGTLLEVLNITDNGWLTLMGGGYVNGKYTKIYSENFKKPAEVKTLSVTPAQLKTLSVTPAIVKQPTSIVKSDSGLVEAHIEEILKGTSLAGQGLEKAILEIEELYGINAYFTIAVMKLESGNGKSKIAKDKNNLFGLNAIDGDQYNKAFSFKTKGDSVQKFGQLISKNYIDKGYTTIEKVSAKYCHANPKWSGVVKNIMKSDYSKL